eukprot:4694743-Prymnesium_polylepis.1
MAQRGRFHVAVGAVCELKLATVERGVGVVVRYQSPPLSSHPQQQRAPIDAVQRRRHKPHRRGRQRPTRPHFFLPSSPLSTPP